LRRKARTAQEPDYAPNDKPGDLSPVLTKSL
jgi:hypothetical protein